MTVLFSDSYTRANGAVGANYDDPSASWTVNANAVDCGSGGFTRHVHVVVGAVADIADVRVSATIKNTGSDGGVIARSSLSGNTAATGSCYVLDVFGGTTWDVYRRIANVDTLVASRSSSYSGGELSTMQITGTGATVTIKIYKNGVQLGADMSDTDAARIVAAGRMGLLAYGNSTFDDLLVEDVTAAVANPPQGWDRQGAMGVMVAM